MDQRFDVMGLGKKVKQFDGIDFVTRGVGFRPSRHAFGLEEYGKVARERRRIARKVGNLRCLQLREFCGGGLA